MKKITVVSTGIDVSRDTLDVAFLASNDTHTVHSFTNTVEGIEECIEVIKKQRTACTVPCVIESTGDFHLLSSLMITKAGFTVNCINPLITKQYQRSSIRNAKTDTIDAVRLAYIGVKEAHLPTFSADIHTITAKKVVAYLGTLEKVRQQLKASTKRLQKTQEDILGIPVDLSGTHDALKAIDRQITLFREYICTHTPHAKTVYELSLSMKGVSKEQIAVLLSVVGDKDFATRDQLVAFVGLDVMPRRSGTWHGKEKLSKRGNPYVRKVLYQIAWGLKQHNPHYQKYYHRLYHEEGKHYTTCLIAIARKFLRFLYAYHWKGSVCPQSIT